MKNNVENWESMNQGEYKMGKLENQILQVLKDERPLTLIEIAEKLDEKPKTVFKSLRKLFENNEICCDTKTRRYSFAKEE